MTKKKKKTIWDIIQEIENHEHEMGYHEDAIHALASELKDKRLTKEQKEALYYGSMTAAIELNIEL